MDSRLASDGVRGEESELPSTGWVWYLGQGVGVSGDISTSCHR